MMDKDEEIERLKADLAEVNREFGSYIYRTGKQIMELQDLAERERIVRDKQIRMLEDRLRMKKWKYKTNKTGESSER